MTPGAVVKALHRTDLFGWSSFDMARDVDFNSVAWIRPGGNVLIDPLPMSAHDLEHLERLGGAALLVITNSDHVRGATELRSRLGALIAGPRAERERFPIACDRWLADGELVVPGLTAIELTGSKTPGELALLLEEQTLITGDLVRAHALGRLHLLPDAKLSDPAAARESVRRLLEHPHIDTVLVGDGWPVAGNGHALLSALLD